MARDHEKTRVPTVCTNNRYCSNLPAWTKCDSSTCSCYKSFVRMFFAYAASLVFSLFVGIFIAHNKKAFNIIFPILDILQSVPILGFLPFAVLFIIHTIPILGSEVSTVFLIFTSMTWAIIFNIIEGARSIPYDIKDASKLNGLTGIKYIFHVIFPALYPAIISGSITGWGGAWYFLFAGEYVTFGKEPPYILEGVGSFIAKSAYSGNLFLSLLGMGILAAMVLFMNTFVWYPLSSRISRYSYSFYSQNTGPVTSNSITDQLDKIYLSFRSFCLSFFPS